MLTKTNHSHINHMIDMFEKEEQPFRKIHRMIDLFEVIIKTHTALMIADYFRIKKLSNNIKFFLSEGLRKPSLGIWQCFTRAIVYDLVLPEEISKDQFIAINKIFDFKVEFYKQTNDNLYVLDEELTEKNRNKIIEKLTSSNYDFIKDFFINEFSKYFIEWDIKISQPESNGVKYNVINLRNNYAHGATPSDEECIKDIKSYSGILDHMLKAQWISETYICVFKKDNLEYKILNLEGEENRISDDLITKVLSLNDNNIKEYMPYLIKENGELLNLFPIMMYKEIVEFKEPSILFFNDLDKKGKSISILNYPYSLHCKAKEMYKPFNEIIDIENWKNCNKTRYMDMLDKENEEFVGRETEIEKLKSFINTKEQGYLFVYGEPGIGKTSLMCKVINELINGKASVIKYYVSRANSTSKIENFQKYIIDELNKYNINISYGKDVKENILIIEDGLKSISKIFKNKKLVIFIDGINEFCYKNESTFIDSLLSDKYDNILIIYSCRMSSENGIQKFYDRIDESIKEKFCIGKLSKNNIWQIVSRRSNKYELTKEYITKIADKSNGNPFYIDLLCTTLENGSKISEVMEMLPETIEQWFQEFINRYKENTLGDCMIQVLDVFAASKDSINYSYVFEVLKQDSNNKFTETDVQNAIDRLQEILKESETNRNHYYIFHESFIEYISSSRKDNIFKSEEKILLLCKQWKKYKEYSFAAYIAQFYATHLYERRRYEYVIKLAMDDDYLDYQIEITNSYNSSLQMYELAFKGAAHDNDYDKAADISIKRIILDEKYDNDTINLLKAIGDNDNFRKLLNKVAFYNQNERVIIYTNLLNYTLFEIINFEKTHEILEHLQENIVDDVTILNWLDIIPMYFLIKIMAKIKELGLDYSVIMKRMEYGSDFSALDIRIGDYNEISSYASWIDSKILTNFENEILKEMKEIVIGFNAEFERKEELNSIKVEEDEYINTRNSKILKLIKTKDINKLVKYFEKNKHEVLLYLNWLNCESVDDAFFNQLIERLKNNDKIRDSLILWLVMKYVKEDIDSAVNCCSYIHDDSKKMQCYEWIIIEYIKKDKIDEAEVLLSKIEKTINFNKNFILEINKNKVITQIIKYYFDKRDIDKVEFYYNKLENLTFTNDKIMCSGYSIELLIIFGRYEEAIELIHYQYKLCISKDVHIFYELIEMLVIRLGINDNIDEACIIAEYIDDKNTRNKVFRNLLDIFIQEEKYKDFIKILNKELIKKEKSSINKEKIDESCIKQLYVEGRAEEGRSLINLTLKKIDSYKNDEVKLVEYKKLTFFILGLEDLDEFLKAYQILEVSIEKSYDDIEKYKEYKEIIGKILISVTVNKDIKLIDILCSILKTKVKVLVKGENIIQQVIDTFIDLEIYDKAEELLNHMERIFGKYSSKEFVEYKIYISNRFVNIKKNDKGKGILQNIFDELIEPKLSIDDYKIIFCVLDEAVLQENIELVEKILECCNYFIRNNGDNKLKLEILYKLSDVYFNFNDTNLLKNNIEKIIELLKGYPNIKVDEKYIYQFYKYGFQNYVKGYIDKQLYNLNNIKIYDNLSSNFEVISDLKELVELMAKINQFDEAFIIVDIIYKNKEFIKVKNSNGNCMNIGSSKSINDNYLLRLMIELMKQNKVDLILDKIKSIQVDKYNRTTKDFLSTLKKIITHINKTEALKLISIMEFKNFNYNYFYYQGTNIMTELYIEGHQEVALVLINKIFTDGHVNIYLEIIDSINCDLEKIKVLFDLNDLIENGEEKVALFTNAIHCIDKKAQMILLEKINSNMNISYNIKTEIYTEIARIEQFIDKDILLNIISHGYFNMDILKKYLEVYSIYIICDKEKHNGNKLDKMKKYIYIPNFYECDCENYNYYNLESWIDKIEDEEDKMIVNLLANKVVKKKMTEANFNDEIKKYLN